MAGNKYADITERNILDTAKRLFLEKGYEQTTLQDIADACGLTRGAIYHHFKGKEEMVDAVTTYIFNEVVPYLDIKNDKTMSGLRKLQHLIVVSLTSEVQIQMQVMLSKTFYKNPKLVAAYMVNCQSSIIPMVKSFIDEGISDGSIQTDNSEILAEVVTVFLEIWLSPVVFQTSKKKLSLKIAYTKTMLDSLVGFPIISKEIVSAFDKLPEALFDL